MSWPSHQAHPLGAKLNGKIRISATNGLVCVSGQKADLHCHRTNHESGLNCSLRKRMVNSKEYPVKPAASACLSPLGFSACFVFFAV
jgi:hypothetical protein